MKNRNQKIRQMLDEQNLTKEERKEAEKLSEQVLKSLEENGTLVDDEDEAEDDEKEASGKSCGNMTEQYIKKIREEKIKAKLRQIEKPVTRGLAVVGLVSIIWWVIKIIKGHSTPAAIGIESAADTVTTVEGSMAVSDAVTAAALDAGADVVTTTF